MSKRSRVNLDFSDDEQVERHLEQVARKKWKKEEAEEAARNLGKDEATLVVEIAQDLEQIVANIEGGDCPFTILSNCYVIVQEPFNLGCKDAVVVLLNHESTQLSADAQLFENLCGDGGISEELESLAPECKTPAAAMSKLVQMAVKEGDVAPTRAAKTTSLFQVWMKDVAWDNCFINSINRPSLASWNGFPWEAGNYCDKSITRNVRNKNVSVRVDFETPDDYELAPSIPQLIWTKKTGRVASFSDALKAGVAAHKAVLTAATLQGGKSSKSSQAVAEKPSKKRNDDDDDSKALIRSHICSVCGNGFVQKQSLQRHMREVHKIAPPPK